MTDTTERHTFICDHCGSNEITCSADAEWDVTAQEWVLSGIQEDLVYCIPCSMDTIKQKVVLENK